MADTKYDIGSNCQCQDGAQCILQTGSLLNAGQMHQGDDGQGNAANQLSVGTGNQR